MTQHASAAAMLAAVVEDGTYEPWDDDVVSEDPLRFVDRLPYAERLEAAATASGRSESLLTGRAEVRGHEIVVIVGDFGFLAGTMGVAAGERLVRAFDRAAGERLPVLAMPISGGTRMQEGTLAFVQMARAADAVARYRASGGRYIVYLRNPTTGGVLGSWASLGHVTFAAPGALIGLTGPRVVEQVTGTPFPAGVQVADHLLAHGIVDDVVPPEDLGTRVGRVLDVLCSAPRPWPVTAQLAQLAADARVDAWSAVTESRRVDRPGIRELLALCADHMTILRGDDAGNDDHGCLLALARVCGVPCVVVGQDRPPGRRGARLGAAGYRKARRGMLLADELGLPLLTVVDTEGVETSVAAEEGGLAREIARCLATITSIRVPTLSVLLGEGSGGGAIALLPADRMVAAQHAWLAPIAPEGASSILFRTTERAPDIAAMQRVASTDLLRLGVVDLVVQDRPDPGEERGAFTQRIVATAASELANLVARNDGERLEARRRRLARLGRVTSGR